MTFRGELQGIAAASRGIFDKEPGGLDDAESAILAALIRSPNAVPEKVGERAAMLALTLNSAGDPDAIKKLARDSLSRSYRVRRLVDLAPHLARELLQVRNARVVSTLDARIQRMSTEILEQALRALSSQNVRDGAALVVDNKTGDVLAYVGNSGSLSSAPFVDNIKARRQAGSTLKPFLYGLAIERKIITAASMIEDSPLDLSTERGVYRPENYDKEFHGLVPVRIALASSMNIPAVKTLGLVGTGNFVQELREFGFGNLAEAEHYGPSLALGSADITLWDLVNAYRTLANAGAWSRLRVRPTERSGMRRQVLSRDAAFIVSSILSDREARSSTFSMESPLGTRFWTAVKTGTSKDMRDNWCVGYSERYTVGVWVGNSSGSPMWNVSGVSGAAPAWLEIMNYLHRGSTSRPPVAPSGVVQRSITYNDYGPTTTRQEWFIAGTEQDAVPTGKRVMRPKIVYPSADTVIAIDPDMPADIQRVMFEVNSEDTALQLVLDDAGIGPGPHVSWQLASGHHQLALVDRNGTVIDRIQFEVR